MKDWSQGRAKNGGQEREHEVLAAAAHMVNRAYSIALGDYSHPTWDEAPDWQRRSSLLGVQAALDPRHTPEQSHQAWLTQKLNEGWTYGPVRDVTAKEHPRMLPYRDLPSEQRRKDDLFISTVREMAKVLGV